MKTSPLFLAELVGVGVELMSMSIVFIGPGSEDINISELLLLDVVGALVILVVDSALSSEVVSLSSLLVEDVTVVIMEEEVVTTTGVLLVTTIVVVVGTSTVEDAIIVELLMESDVLVVCSCIDEVDMILEDITAIVNGFILKVDVDLIVEVVTDGTTVEVDMNSFTELLEGGSIEETSLDMDTNIEDVLEGGITVVVVDISDGDNEALDDCIAELEVTVILDDLLVDDMALVETWDDILGLEMTVTGGPV